MLRVLGILVLIALYISFIIDVIRTPRAEVRSRRPCGSSS